MYSNRIQLIREANNIVLRYMQEGWLLNGDDGSSGYNFRVDLEKGTQRIRVGFRFTHHSIEDAGHEFELDGFILSALQCDDEGWEKKDSEPLYLKQWYCLSKWGFINYKELKLTDSVDEAIATIRCRESRRNSRIEGNQTYQLKPSAHLLNMIRSNTTKFYQQPFRQADSSNIKVTKGDEFGIACYIIDVNLSGEGKSKGTAENSGQVLIRFPLD